MSMLATTGSVQATEPPRPTCRQAPSARVQTNKMLHLIDMNPAGYRVPLAGEPRHTSHFVLCQAALPPPHVAI
jgi:hypothetical protein